MMKKIIWISGLGCLAAVFMISGEAYAGRVDVLQSKTAGVATVLEDVSEKEIQEEQRKLAKEAEENHWGYKNLGIAHVDNHLNVREQPNEEAKLVGKMSKDTACEIIAIEGNWAQIKSGKVEGYVSLDFLYTGEEAIKRGEEVVSTVGTVNTTTLKVRGEPSTESICITMIPLEEELEVVEVLDGWVKFMLDDEEAYVSTEFLDLEQKLGTAVTMKELQYGEGVSNVRVDLVKFAQKHIGNPYVWGGTSLTRGADCSGFVLSVFKNFGVSLPRSSREQVRVGTKISPSEAQPGDLFFYAKNGVVNHVAIYIGSGQVVHASSPKTGIKISGSHYRTPYMVKRVLP